MAKRGRKPKEKKGYFYEDEENAIVRYIETDDEYEKNKIFDAILYPALTKMIESIIRTYKLFVPDEEFDQNFSDTISYLLTKINHFKPLIYKYEPYEGDIEGIEFIDITEDDLRVKNKNVSEEDPEYLRLVTVDISDDEEEITQYQYLKKTEHKYKAYSYCGTVCKNYLMYKCAQYAKKRQRNTPYDDVFEEINNDSKYSVEETTDQSSIAENLVNGIANDIHSMIENRDKNGLSDDEVTVGNALISLLKNWEDVLPKSGSNKLQKSAVLYFLREETLMTTKEVRDNMAKFKKVYYLLKKNMIEE